MKNPLTDLLPPKVRQVVYAIVFLALLGFSAVEAAGGDTGRAIFLLLTSLAPLLAGGNITPGEPAPPTEE